MPSTAPKRLWLLSVLALVGAGANAYLSKLFYDLRNGTMVGKSICTVSQKVNCESVAASKWAELFPGVPLSSVAAGALAALFIVSLIARISSRRKSALQVSLFITLMGSLMGIIWLIIMAGSIHVWCLFCLLTDFCCLVSLGIVLSLKKEWTRKSETPEAIKEDKTGLNTSVAAMMVVTGIVFLGLKQNYDIPLSQSDIDDMAVSVFQGPRVAVPFDDKTPSYGPINAAVTIVEFSDFQCPHCKRGLATLHALLMRYPDQIRVVLKSWPIDSKCNREIKNGGHDAACEAAQIFKCASAQNKTELAHDVLFDRQEELAPGRAALFTAEVTGLNADQLTQCAKQDDIQNAVVRDVEDGINLGVGATPTYFINGYKVEGPQPVAVWERLVEHVKNGK